MAFRDELSAAHARADALERDNAELRAKNDELRLPSTATAAETQSRSVIIALVALAWTLVLTAVIFAGAGAGLAIVIGLVILVPVLFVLSIVEVVPPGFALVISGRLSRLADGTQVGYRVVSGGRALRIPFIEKVAKIDLRQRRIGGVCALAEPGDLAIKPQAFAAALEQEADATLGSLGLVVEILTIETAG